VELRADWVEEPAGYLVRSERAREPLPAILVIQELWGLDRHIRDVAERFATAGYLAFAPDLYRRDGGRPAPLAEERIRAYEDFLDTMPVGAWGDEEARETALSERADAADLRETFAALSAGDREAFLRELERCLSWLRERAPAVGSVGWCMGGALSARLAASSTPPDAAVMFYGTPPDEETAPKVGCPLLGFFGGADHRITQWVEPSATLLREHGKAFEHHVYEDAPHAFFNDTRSSYRLGPSRDAWARTLAFFAERLRA
jgi:carboxymethylenebutenolidase